MAHKRVLKVVRKVLDSSRDVDFATIKKLLELFGYECKQPRGGSSHFVFRKSKSNPITVPKKRPVNVVYVKMISRILNLEAWYEKNS